MNKGVYWQRKVLLFLVMRGGVCGVVVLGKSYQQMVGKCWFKIAFKVEIFRIFYVLL